jgi:hypothetical protein
MMARSIVARAPGGKGQAKKNPGEPGGFPGFVVPREQRYLRRRASRARLPMPAAISGSAAGRGIVAGELQLPGLLVLAALSNAGKVAVTASSKTTPIVQPTNVSTGNALPVFVQVRMRGRRGAIVRGVIATSQAVILPVLSKLNVKLLNGAEMGVRVSGPAVNEKSITSVLLVSPPVVGADANSTKPVKKSAVVNGETKSVKLFPV